MWRCHRCGTDGQTTTREDRATQLLIYAILSFTISVILAWVELLPVCTFRRPVWLTPPAKMSGSEWGLTLTFRNLLTKPAELVSHDLWQKPHPCAFKILSFHKMTSNTSVAFGQATSSGFLGSIALSCGQKPLSPFLAPLWPDSNLKILERFLTLQVAHHPNGPFWVEKQ